MRWYEYLFARMVDGGRFEENKLSVITFNYDRSLEAFLVQALSSLYKLSPERAWDIARTIPIIHLYGSLGESVVSDRQAGKRGYAPDRTLATVSEAARQLRIMYEAEGGPAEQRAREFLMQAGEVVFLGFGFHEINLDRLGLTERGSTRGGLFASRVGMGDGEIQRALSAMPHFRSVTTFGRPDQNSLTEFLKNTPCLI
jgi:hypothetical protein